MANWLRFNERSSSADAQDDLAEHVAALQALQCVADACEIHLGVDYRYDPSGRQAPGRLPLRPAE